MIVAPQIGNISRPYDKASVSDQLKMLWKRLEDRKQSLSCLKWICFTTRSGKFVAYQPHYVFAHEIVYKGVNKSIDILNTYEEDKFRNEIVESVDHPESASHAPFDFLREAWSDSAHEHVTTREALKVLLSASDWTKDHMMLVSYDDKPVGVVSLRALVQRIFREILDERDYQVETTGDSSADNRSASRPEAEDNEDYTEAFEADVANDIVGASLPDINSATTAV
jgi:hypothetical protein